MKIANIMLHSTKLISVQYQVFYFCTGKASAEFKDVHITIPKGAPSITPYTKSAISLLDHNEQIQSSFDSSDETHYKYI